MLMTVTNATMVRMLIMPVILKIMTVNIMLMTTSMLHKKCFVGKRTMKTMVMQNPNM